MKKQTVKIFNESKNELPNYSTILAAGFDIRADFSRITSEEDFKGNENFMYNDIEKKVTLFASGGRILIPTGLYIGLPDGFELQIRPRSGMALKFGISIVNSPGTIDSDYKGEIGIVLINTDTYEDFEIFDGDRIAQAVLNAINQIEWDAVGSKEELGESERGDGGFGHTGGFGGKSVLGITGPR